MKNIFEVSRKVHEAITSKKPIVALESTLISHGLPYPENIQVANESIKAVEDNGAIAATIGIIKGKVKIGLSNEDIELLAKDSNVQKVSNHNINLSIFNKENAATTVASTISIASKFQIKFFATGGIGGVHLNAKNTNDVSADLYALSENSNFVICSGAKSILDLSKTNELLETLGITRIGYQTNFMPGFWYEETENKVDNKFDEIHEISSFLKLSENLENKKSILIFNKVPLEKAINKDDVEKWINNATLKAKKDSISGKELTPFLIKEINEQSKNETLNTNASLIINNANLAGKIAKNFYS